MRRRRRNVEGMRGDDDEEEAFWEASWGTRGASMEDLVEAFQATLDASRGPPGQSWAILEPS